MMESLREANRIIEQEIAKGSSPLRFQRIDMDAAEYQNIDTRERLMEVLHYLLRISNYRIYANKSTQNNMYTDFKDLLLKKMVPRRTRNIVERNEIFMKICRYGGRVKPDYEGKTYVETVPCYFEISEQDLERWKYEYEGHETYAFMLTNKHLARLCQICLEYRVNEAKECVKGDDEIRNGIITMDGVRTCLFQALILDDIELENGIVKAKLYTIYLLQ